MDINTIVLLITIIGCFVGLAGWQSTRDRKIVDDAEWRGNINGKLDAILGIDRRVSTLEADVKEQGKQIALIEQTARSAHHRIDELSGGKHEK